MGALCAISAIVASSRQTFHSNDIGTLDELRVIAAAVIGGTALSGGIGTIYGAILGRLDHAVAAIGHGHGRRRCAAARTSWSVSFWSSPSRRHHLPQAHGELSP
jgi:outer membrane lipoprotein SlyB